MLFRGIVEPDLAARYRADGWYSDETVADHVRRHGRERPDADAYVTDVSRLSWRGLDGAADRVAAALVAAGADPGDRLAVWVPDGPTVHAVFVGAERAGQTVVGIGARAGRREIEHLVRRTGATRILTLGEHRGEDQADAVAALRAGGLDLGQHVVVPRFELDPAAPIVVDGSAVTAARLEPDDEARRRVGPDDLFLVNSTSGTTGLPKIVLHHQNRWTYFHRKAVANGAMTGDDVFLSVLPAPFGFGLWTSHVTPINLGATTVTLEHFDADVVAELIERERVTVLGCVSTQFILLLASPEVDRRDFSSLRVMFTGGEAVPYERAVEFEARTGATVLQFYGSNETGLLSGTVLGDPPERRLRTAGRVVAEMQVRLFADGEDVTAAGRGQPGCRGPATSVGYLDDPAANAALFTADGWMLMADICTIDDEGYLQVVGRTSDIIIRGGKNISAPEVEAEVATHPDVVHAAAVPVPDPVFGERVAAYVQLRPGAELALDALVAHLLARGVTKDTLPEYLVVLDALPISSGGKVAKGDLRADVAQRFPSPS